MSSSSRLLSNHTQGMTSITTSSSSSPIPPSIITSSPSNFSSSSFLSSNQEEDECNGDDDEVVVLDGGIAEDDEEVVIDGGIAEDSDEEVVIVDGGIAEDTSDEEEVIDGGIGEDSDEEEVIDGEIVNSEDDDEEEVIDDGIVKEGGEIDVRPSKKRRQYSAEEKKRKIDSRRQTRAVTGAYKKGVKDTQKIEENKMLDKISNGEYVYFGSNEEQIVFLKDFLEFDANHLSPRDLAVKYSTTKVLWEEHKGNKRRKKTFKAFHDEAYYELVSILSTSIIIMDILLFNLCMLPKHRSMQVIVIA